MVGADIRYDLYPEMEHKEVNIAIRVICRCIEKQLRTTFNTDQRKGLCEAGLIALQNPYQTDDWAIHYRGVFQRG
jgi:hypothetical protein